MLEYFARYGEVLLGQLFVRQIHGKNQNKAKGQFGGFREREGGERTWTAKKTRLSGAEWAQCAAGVFSGAHGWG